MRIGISSSINFFDEVLAAKADYIEINVQEMLRMDESAYAEFKAKALAHKGFVYAANCLFPFANFRLTGEDVDEQKIREYCDKVFPLMAEVGVKIVVFGSGGAKRVPEGFSFDKAWAQLESLSKILAEYAEKYDQTVVIEPLRTQECNIVLSVKEACDLADVAESDHVAGLVDYFHFCQNGHNLEEDLAPYVGKIQHAHIASPIERTAPRADDGFDYKSFTDVLRQGGYDGTLTYEGKLNHNTGEIDTLVAYLKSL